MNSVSIYAIFFKLFKTYFSIACQQFIGKIVNIYIWVVCSLFVTGYVMQSFGLTTNFGSFQLATIIGTVGLFEIYGNCMRSIMDFEGDRTISYYLTLPTTPTVVLLATAASYACMGIVLALIMLPGGKLILFNTFDITTISWPTFIVITVVANIFFAIATLAITAHVGTMPRIENVWSRFIFPLWFLGGFQFSWSAIFTLSKPLAFLLLCNPVIYVMEGTRGALLGQQDCLPFWICCSMLIVYSIACWIYSYRKTKKLLDFVG